MGCGQSKSIEKRLDRLEARIAERTYRSVAVETAADSSDTESSSSSSPSYII